MSDLRVTMTASVLSGMDLPLSASPYRKYDKATQETTEQVSAEKALEERMDVVVALAIKYADLAISKLEDT